MVKADRLRALEQRIAALEAIIAELAGQLTASNTRLLRLAEHNVAYLDHVQRVLDMLNAATEPYNHGEQTTLQ